MTRLLKVLVLSSMTACTDDMLTARDTGSTSSAAGTSSDSTQTSALDVSTSASESGTTDPMPCMADEQCTEIEAPQCVGGAWCMACMEGEDGDAACNAVDATRPLCADGVCVQCTAAAPEACTGMTPVCDDATNTCVPCMAHEQCSSGACELAVGLCFPDDFVVHVDGDGDGGADYTTIVAAVADVPDDAHGVIVVHELDGGDDYGPTVISGGNKTIALLAAPGESPIIQGTADQGLRVSEAGIMVYVDGLTIAGNTSGRGLRVDLDAHVWVDRSRIVQNSGGGIQVDGGAVLTLRNCFVGSLGDVVGLEIIDSSASLLYSTITASTFGNTPALSCTTPVAVDIRNSIILSQGGMPLDEISCDAETITNTATEADVGSFDAGWFTGFNAGDYHLSASGTATFADIAQWQTGDPITDIDGEPRPTVNVTPDYAGADVP